VDEIKVLSRTQRIVVSADKAVTVVNAGPQGPPGRDGTPGGAIIGRRWYGEGAPELIIGAAPGDEYLDLVTGDLYILQ
jgi:hypothetical protein